MKEAIFNVVLKDGKPYLKWTQYETTYLRIWKANSENPYIKYMSGFLGNIYLDENMKDDLRKLMNHEGGNEND